MPADDRLADLSATALIALLKRRDISPTDVVESCIARIETYNPSINAVTATCYDRARSEAKESERRYRDGKPIGPLDGLPLGVKDLQNTEGLLTTYGSPQFRGNVPRADWPLIAQLRAAGAIVLGKTNVPEMGAGGNSRNPVWGATGNPFNTNLVAGGSSGGSAAALATGMMPLCTGSDTGGSLRLPAALCGVIGFRPSPDVVAHPTRPLGWSAISVIGPMARTMDDLILMLQSSIGLNPDDPLSASHQASEYAFGEIPDMSELRIGYSDDFGGCPVDEDIRQTFRDRIAVIAPQVKDCRPVDLQLGDMDKCFDIIRAESFVAAFDRSGTGTNEALGANIRANLELAETMSFRDRAWAHLEQTRILRAYNAAMDGLDLILTPTSPVSPFPWTQSHATKAGNQDLDIYYRWLALTYRASLIGSPALILPCGLDAHKMPFGMQLHGRPKHDAILLNAARSLEAFFETQPELRRPRLNLGSVRPSDADLKSIVTHPPEITAAPSERAVKTAV